MYLSRWIKMETGLLHTIKYTANQNRQHQCVYMSFHLAAGYLEANTNSTNYNLGSYLVQQQQFNFLRYSFHVESFVEKRLKKKI